MAHGIVFEECVELFIDGFFDLQIRLDLTGLKIPRLDALKVSGGSNGDGLVGVV